MGWTPWFLGEPCAVWYGWWVCEDAVWVIYSHTDCATMLNAIKRTHLDGRQLKRYIASMREVVDFYKSLGFKSLNDCSNCSLNHNGGLSSILWIRLFAMCRATIYVHSQSHEEANVWLARRRSGAAARHLTSSNSVATRQNASKLASALAAPSFLFSYLPQRGNNSIIYLYIIIIIYKLNIRYLVRIAFSKWRGDALLRRCASNRFLTFQIKRR